MRCAKNPLGTREDVEDLTPRENVADAGFEMLHVKPLTLSLGDPLWVSEWVPSTVQRALLRRVGRVRLMIYGPGHPFVQLGVTTNDKPEDRLVAQYGDPTEDDRYAIARDLCAVQCVPWEALNAAEKKAYWDIAAVAWRSVLKVLVR